MAIFFLNVINNQKSADVHVCAFFNKIHTIHAWENMYMSGSSLIENV